MATNLKMASSTSEVKAKSERVNERANDNAYLKLPNADDWKDVVIILTDA